MYDAMRLNANIFQTYKIFFVWNPPSVKKMQWMVKCKRARCHLSSCSPCIVLEGCDFAWWMTGGASRGVAPPSVTVCNNPFGHSRDESHVRFFSPPLCCSVRSVRTFLFHKYQHQEINSAIANGPQKILKNIQYIYGQ